ncbi:MAG: FtsW/RodA/SpoVE family cell cycle protein [Prevotella sp.]|nr:FtsW/RodA/SpoVE family cell cycle protein [Prevotella sp.]
MSHSLGNIFKGDKVIWMVFFILCIISVVEVFSASSELTYKGGNYLAPAMKHVGILLGGIFCMLCTIQLKCKYFKAFAYPLLIFSVITLIIVYLTGQSTNGASRWISILGIQFQPSEVAKGTMVLITAQILSAMQTPTGCDRHAFNYILIVGLFIVPLIMLENLSTAVLLCLVIWLMMIIGRVPTKQWGGAASIVVLLAAVAVIFCFAVGGDESEENPKKNLTEKVDQGTNSTDEKDEGGITGGIFHRATTWKNRMLKFVNNKNIPPEQVDLDKDAQVAHANIAIASSNIIGKGPGNSVERDFLAQAFSDFIYAIIIEEMGIEGAFVVALLYIILLFRTGRIASRCENNFPAFLALGLALLLVIQALFNMSVAVGIVPVTGQPLPLISKGGTSTLINCIYVGVILSVSRTAKKRVTTQDDNKNKVAAASRN